MFEVLGVIDLRAGRAVHAVSGDRERYLPARMVTDHHSADGDAVALASTYITALTIAELYVADLDAILDRAPQLALVHDIGALGAPIWLDAGISAANDATAVLASGADRLVVGLETLPSFDALVSICQEIGGERVAFSLDLRNRLPLAPSDALARQTPESLAARAIDAGASAVIVLDLARVGSNEGPDLDLIERVRAAVPAVRLIAAGGVRGRDDLVRLKDAGCNGALVATALLTGQLTASDIAGLRT